MNRRPEPDQKQLSRSIRREMGSPMTARFARSLPFLRTSDGLPAILLDLLDRLEEQEQAADRPKAACGRRGLA